ncbi:hypothetical protein LVD16_13485 [Fulvivirga ligni]|nr:hypothetical protein LVD16_13485 [Fulvivirga ligni]
MQILNGGIYQYFSNYGNSYNSEIIIALKTLNQIELASSFEEMCELTAKKFDEAEKSFKNFDNWYYSRNMQKSMDMYLKEYIIKNLTVFQTN